MNGDFIPLNESKKEFLEGKYDGEDVAGPYFLVNGHYLKLFEDVEFTDLEEDDEDGEIE